MRNISVLVVTIAIGFVAATRVIGAPFQHTITLSLSNPTVDVQAYDSELRLTLYGEFRVPIIDPTKYEIVSLSGALSEEAGGAIWRTGRPEEVMYGNVGSSWAIGPYSPIGFHGSGAGTDGWSSIFSKAYVVTLDDVALTGQYLPNASQIYGQDVYNEGEDYVPLSVQIYQSAGGALAYVPPPYNPSALVFIGSPTLEFTYVLEAIDPEAGPLPESNLAPFNFWMESSFAVDPVYPHEVVQALPSYLAIPEPSVLGFVSGTLLLLMRRRRTWAGHTVKRSGACVARSCLVR